MDDGKAKREIINLWKDWPNRTRFIKTGDIGTGALLFYASLKGANKPIVNQDVFGRGDPYQRIKMWIEQWEASEGWGYPPPCENQG